MTLTRYRALIVVVAAIASASALAQDNAGPERQARTAAQAAERAENRDKVIEVQLREAEERLAEAAAQVAELSRSRLPDMHYMEGRLRRLNQPVLGVTIGAGEDEGPVEGVTVRGVTPGSAAEEAGLRAGDVLTAINDESLSADSEERANQKLLDFMSGVEPGDTLDLQYLRNGDSRSVEVKPQPGFAATFGSRRWPMPIAPMAPGARMFALDLGGNWGDMEMVSLTEDLGRYFGTDEGLLVVRAPKDDGLKLRDGDVIQSIDGREPGSASHAMRILASYAPGETLEIEIMRDRKRQTLLIEMPDRRQGRLHFELAAPAIGPEPAPKAAPAPAADADRI